MSELNLGKRNSIEKQVAKPSENDGFAKGHLFIYLALAKPALPGQFDLLVSSQSKEKR
jgi:hypothetical protein